MSCCRRLVIFSARFSRFVREHRCPANEASDARAVVSELERATPTFSAAVSEFLRPLEAAAELSPEGRQILDVLRRTAGEITNATAAVAGDLLGHARTIESGGAFRSRYSEPVALH